MKEIKNVKVSTQVKSKQVRVSRRYGTCMAIIRYIKYIPLLILSISVLYCIHVAVTTYVGLMGKHYWGIGFVTASVFAVFFKERISIYLTVLTLILGVFNVIAFTPSIKFYSLGIKINGASVGIQIQQFSLFVSVLFLAVNFNRIVTIFRGTPDR